MSISDSKIKQIIREETKRALHEADVKGATFHQDPITGKWVTGGEDFPGAGGRAAMKLREPEMLGVATPKHLDMLARRGEQSPDYADEDPDSNSDMPSDNDTFEPHDYSRRLRLSRSTNRFEPLDIDSSGEDRPMHDPDVDYETGETNRKRGGGDSGNFDDELSENSRSAFRKIVKEETLKFLRNRR
jgi:hypothetical protein